LKYLSYGAKVALAVSIFSLIVVDAAKARSHLEWHSLGGGSLTDGDFIYFSTYENGLIRAYREVSIHQIAVYVFTADSSSFSCFSYRFLGIHGGSYIFEVRAASLGYLSQHLEEIERARTYSSELERAREDRDLTKYGRVIFSACQETLREPLSDPFQIYVPYRESGESPFALLPVEGTFSANYNWSNGMLNLRFTPNSPSE
jgi:hypothetical protein